MKQRQPTIAVTKSNDMPSGKGLEISGKRVEKTPKISNKADLEKNKNEFTFSPTKRIDDLTSSAQNSKKSLLPPKREVKTGESRIPSKNEILEKLGIMNPEAEKVMDLSTAALMANSGNKSKAELTKEVMTNIENEINKLKYKRDFLLAEKEKKEREQAYKRQNREEDEIIIYDQEDRAQTLLHPISSLEKPSLENVEALKRAHQLKMAEVERKYQERKKEKLLSEIDHNIPKSTLSVKFDSPIHGGIGSKTHDAIYEREELDDSPKYASHLPPRSQKSGKKDLFKNYVSQKELEKERQTNIIPSQSERIRIQQKEENAKSYQERFQEYVKAKTEVREIHKSVSPPKNEGFDVYMPTSPNPKRSISRNKWDNSEDEKRESRKELNKSVDNKKNESFTSLTRKSRAHSAKKFEKLTVEIDEKEIPQSELALLKWVFNLMRKNDSLTVVKDDVYKYLYSNKDILEYYEIDPDYLQNDLDSFKCKNPKKMTFTEFLTFLKSYQPQKPEKIEEDVYVEEVDHSPSKRPKRKEPKFEAEPPKEIKKNVSLLNEEILNALKEIFHAVDKYEDLIVKRLELIKKVREDVRIARILHKPAIHIQEIDKYISLERILRQIEDEEKNVSSDQKKSKEYLSLNQFMKYFVNYETPANLADQITEEPKKRTPKLVQDDDSHFVDIHPEHLEFFKTVFNTVPETKRGFVETVIYVDSIRQHEHYHLIATDVGRRKGVSTDLESETIEEVVNRIEIEAENTISFDEFKQFFTRLGRPKNLLAFYDKTEKALIESGLIADPKNKAAQTNMKNIPISYERDGYDSDPELHTYSKDVNYDYRLNKSVQHDENELNQSEIISEKSLRRSTQDVGYQTNIEKKSKKVTINDTSFEYRKKARTEGDFRGKKYTIPEPFEFDTRDQIKPKSIRERKIEEMVREKIEEEEKRKNHRFRPKKIPASVKDNLFQKLMDAQEDRRREVKKNSVAITKMREAPFSFYLRDKEKPSKEEPPLNQEFGKRFIPKPIPPICQVPDLWIKMKEKDDVERKERINKLAQENLLLASLPPRMEEWEKKKKEEELRQKINEKNQPRKSSSKSFVANRVPDFERLHSQFQNLLDRKRKNKRPTEPVPFNFQESTKGVARDYLDVENQYKKAAKDEFKRDPFEAVIKLKQTKPKYQPHTTKKMVAMMDRLKQEREEKQKRLDQKQREEQERIDRYNRMKPKVQESPAIQDNTQNLEKRAQETKNSIKSTFEKSKRDFENMKKGIDSRVASRPLLVEQETKKNYETQLEAAKHLINLKKLMKESGIKNPEAHFTQEEKEKLQDAEFLIKKGLLKVDNSDI